MSYSLDHIAAALKAARESKGLTQRQLKDLAGLPQGHISRIENGSVDLKLSTLIELARILDLEVMLIPRSFVPAVENFVPYTARSKRSVAKELQQIRNLATHWPTTEPKNFAVWKKLARATEELGNIRLSSDEREGLREAVRLLKRAHDEPNSSETVSRTTEYLRALRDRVFHDLDAETAPRPAYSLDEEDDDA